MSKEKLYEAVMVETVYLPIEGGLSMAMTSAEFGEMFNKSEHYLTCSYKESKTHGNKYLFSGRYMVELVYTDLEGERIYYVEEVERVTREVKGSKRIRGTLKEIARELDSDPKNIQRNIRKGFLVLGEYRVERIEENDKEGTKQMPGTGM